MFTNVKPDLCIKLMLKYIFTNFYLEILKTYNQEY